jgi:hypothetical protein
MVALTGCGDSKQVTEVKALPFGDANMTVDQTLDTRKICDSVGWEVKQDDRNQTYVEYTCKYKDLSDSAFLARDKTTNAKSAGDVYQWTYGPNGEPTLTAAGFVTRYTNGSVRDFKVNPTAVMQLAVNNKVSSFDEAWATFFNVTIPKKPAKDITDTTYGNKLSELYPDEPPVKAAADAIYWKGAPNVQVGNLDKLGYPLVTNTDSRFLFPVDPGDVQVAVKVDPADVDSTAVSMPQTPDKLFCVNQACYDSFNNLHFYVGSAPASVVARETAPTPKSTAVAAAPASASTADSLPTGSSDEAVPAMTPCIQKLDNAFVKDAQAHGTSEGVSDDMVREWANTCKTIGQ